MIIRFKKRNYKFFTNGIGEIDFVSQSYEKGTNLKFQEKSNIVTNSLNHLLKIETKRPA